MIIHVNKYNYYLAMRGIYVYFGMCVYFNKSA